MAIPTTRNSMEDAGESREGTPARRSGDSAAATVSGSTGEGLAGLRHGGAYQQRDVRLQRRTSATRRSSPVAAAAAAAATAWSNGAVAHCRADRSPTRQQQWTMEA
ncbi:hypothetical protein Scep_011911 [Stephania cephalantha]|uniref:Uncharacterized protein n=1 Tax=Stephania cephalantha TaxID=152367 RepID=A0AAP0P6A5_9MAGN